MVHTHHENAFQRSHGKTIITLGPFLVVHQAISVHLPFGFQTRFSQCFDKIVPVNVVHIDVLAPITPAHDVINIL
jgi:hypothetical protein